METNNLAVNQQLSKQQRALFAMNHINHFIFNETKSHCNPHSDDIPITKYCSHSLRICAAMRYFHVLRTSTTLNEEEKRELFVQFNQNIYRSLLDDTIHFVKKHENDIERIHREWTEIYGLPKCSVTECVQTARHYERGTRERKRECNNKKEDAVYNVYENEMDRIHFYIFHLFDVGMRVNTMSLALSDEEDDEKKVDSVGVSVDKLFAAERDHIKMRRTECKVDFHRFDEEHSKFTIGGNKQKGMTATDAVFENLLEEQTVRKEIFQQIHQFLVQNGFDSDAMELDLENIADSNLCTWIQNKSITEALRNLIEFISCTFSVLPSVVISVSLYFLSLFVSRSVNESSFSPGCVFEYKYGTTELFVKPVHETLRDEIVESSFVSRALWFNVVILKARNYLKSESVRKMRSSGLDKGRPITLQHLIAIILYCDIGPLCTAFSETFRKENVFESMESVKKRHSRYAIFGKLLVELVRDFGTDGRVDGGGERGPFFCGINGILNVGSFAICLNGPCSTSTVRTVALGFATSGGIIVKLNNDGHDSQAQRFFNCQWISNYPEESERLWIAGEPQFALRIESIVIAKTAKNYAKTMKAFYLFDAMLSGVYFGYDCPMKEEQTDCDLIFNLMDWTKKSDGMDAVHLDFYLQNEWKLFLQNKEEIMLDLPWIDNYYKLMSKCVFHNVVNVMAVNYGTASGKHNVLKSEWISMFPSLRIVKIWTLGDWYKFRLEELLESMRSIPRSVTVIVEDRGMWIKNATTAEISAAFGAAGWDMEYDGEHFRLRGSGALYIKSKKESVLNF